MKKFLIFLLCMTCFLTGIRAQNTLAGTLTVQKWVKVQGNITAALTASQNDFNPTGLSTAGVLYLTTSSTFNITGIVPTTALAGNDGRVLWVFNADPSSTITLSNQSSSSSAANRFAFGSDVVLAPQGPGAFLIYDNALFRWLIVGGSSSGGGGGSGSVNSVALSLPSSVFTVSGSPVTSTGTLAATFQTQSVNQIFAGPTTGSAATPTFRGLVAADIPSLASIYQPLATNLTAIGSLANALGWLHNNGSGTLTYSTPTKSDVGLGSVENTALSTWSGSTNLTTLGTIGTGTWNGTSIADAYISSASTWNAKESALTFSTGLTRSTNTITVNTSQNIATLSNLTANGFVKTGGAAGTLSIDTSTYITGNQNITATGDVSGSGTTAITLAIGAGKVTNTMLAGSIAFSKLIGTDITALGTVVTGTWNGASIADTYISSASAWNAKESALTFSTGLTRTGNTITVNTSQNIATLSNLTTNGFVKTGGAAGTLSIDTSTYLTTGSASSTYQPLASILTTLASYNSNGLFTQTASGTYTGRTITGTASRIALTNGSGVSGNPTIDIDAAYVGQSSITTLGTITTGTWSGTVIATGSIATTLTGKTLTTAILNGTLGATTPSTVAATTISASSTITTTAPLWLNVTGITTGTTYQQAANTGGSFRLGLESSTGNSLVGSGTAYATVLSSVTNTPVLIGVNNAVVATFSSTGLAVTGTVSSTGTISYNGAVNGGFSLTDGTTVGVVYASAASTHSLVVGTTSNHPLLLFSNNAQVAAVSSTGLAVTGVVTATGNAGLGTTSPDVFSRGYGRILGITGSSNSAIELNSATGNGVYFDMGVNGTRVFSIYADTTSSDISTVGSKPITLSPNGSVIAQFSSTGLAVTGTLSTSAPSGGTAGNWKLGSLVTGVTDTLLTTQYIQVDIGGTLYKLATVSSVP